MATAQPRPVAVPRALVKTNTANEGTMASTAALARKAIPSERVAVTPRAIMAIITKPVVAGAGAFSSWKSDLAVANWAARAWKVAGVGRPKVVGRLTQMATRQAPTRESTKETESLRLALRHTQARRWAEPAATITG